MKRECIYAGQAPEAFRLGTYLEANCALLPDEILKINGSTESVILVGLDIAMIPGEAQNYKITTRADLQRFEQEIENIYEMKTEMNMRILQVSTQPINAIPGLKQFQEKLSRERDSEVSSLQYTLGERREMIGEIKAFHPDVLITTDLAGFEQCTLTDNISYNLLDCKQLHFLLHKKLPNEPYLAGQLSIAMFFYCAGDMYYDYLLKKYPNLPYLKSLSEWRSETNVTVENSNAEILYKAFREVVQACKLCQ